MPEQNNAPQVGPGRPMTDMDKHYLAWEAQAAYLKERSESWKVVARAAALLECHRMAAEWALLRVMFSELLPLLELDLPEVAQAIREIVMVPLEQPEEKS